MASDILIKNRDDQKPMHYFFGEQNWKIGVWIPEGVSAS
jgi:hypothetical protein